VDGGKHLSADGEDEIVLPFDVFGGVGKAEALATNPVSSHFKQTTTNRAGISSLLAAGLARGERLKEKGGGGVLIDMI
jgi:hypothetical protein